MGELQATIDFSVEIGKFHNVDLFQRGFYQIRAYFKNSPKHPMKCEVALSKPSNNDLVFAQFTQKDVAYGKTFQILYKKEEILLNDVFSFKVHALVDSHKIEECINDIPFQLVLELYFSDTDIGPTDAQALQFSSSRTLKLHFDYRKGLHHHVPVLFDYFHLSAVTMTVHGTLLAIHQPSINFSKPVKSGWFGKLSNSNSARMPSSNLETILFGCPIRQLPQPTGSTRYAVPIEKILQATQMHRYVCSILLSSHEGIYKNYTEMLTCLPHSMRVPLDKVDYDEKLDKICDHVQNLTSLDEVVETVNRDLAKLSAEMCIIWKKYLDLMGENHYVIISLMDEHHTNRIQRFSEAFFTIDNPREMAMAFHEYNDKGVKVPMTEVSSQGHAYMSQAVRSSLYFHSIPSLQIECIELDGDVTTLPVIFEEKYLRSVSYNQVSPVDLDQIQATVKEVKAQTKNSKVNEAAEKNRAKLPESTADPSKLQKTLRDTRSKPKFGTKSFIKNMKPDSFKRPSSARSDTDQVVLLGYKQYGLDGGTLASFEADLEREATRHAFARTSASSVSLPTLLISDLKAAKHLSLQEFEQAQALFNISHSDVDLSQTNDPLMEHEQCLGASGGSPSKTPTLSHLRQHSVDIGVLRSHRERIKVHEEVRKLIINGAPSSGNGAPSSALPNSVNANAENLMPEVKAEDVKINVETKKKKVPTATLR